MSSFDIVIDPGHGDEVAVGHSSAIGVRGPSGTMEKDVTMRLADLLVGALGATAVLTRRDDSNLSLAARAEVARAAQARVFVSLHANGGAADARGAEAWIHDRANDGSRSLAARVLAALDALADAPRSRGVKTGTMAVLTPELLAPETSACLLEVDFLSSPDGERRLTDGGALDAIAATLARALRDHVSMRPMPAPLPMPSPMPMSASESLPAPAPAAWRAGEGTASAPPTLAGPSSPAVVRVQVAEDRPPARATNGTWHALGRHELYEND